MKIKAVPVLFFTVLLACVSVQQAKAFDIESLIGSQQITALFAGEKPLLAQFGSPVPKLIPQHEVLKSLIESIRQDLNPSVMVETLHLYKKPQEAEKTAWSAEEETALYNEMLALSTLAGLQYYSATRDTMRTFYETSSVIDSPSSKKPIADPVYSEPRPALTLFARQKDLTFGDNIYQYDYYNAPGTIIFVQENLTSLTYGIIPAVGKNKLHSTVAIIDAGEYLLVYAASMAKAASIPGMKERIGNSFSNRAIAVIDWFSQRADKAFKL